MPELIILVNNYSQTLEKFRFGLSQQIIHPLWKEIVFVLFVVAPASLALSRATRDIQQHLVSEVMWSWLRSGFLKAVMVAPGVLS